MFLFSEWTPSFHNLAINLRMCLLFVVMQATRATSILLSVANIHCLAGVQTVYSSLLLKKYKFFYYMRSFDINSLDIQQRFCLNLSVFSLILLMKVFSFKNLFHSRIFLNPDGLLIYHKYGHFFLPNNQHKKWWCVYRISTSLLSTA